MKRLLKSQAGPYLQLGDVARPLGDVTPWHDTMWPAFLRMTLGLLVEGWVAVCSDGALRATWHENQFSSALYLQLLRLRDQRDDLRIFSFSVEGRILDEAGVLSGGVDPDTSPRVEIFVRHAGMPRQPYLGCEAKVLTAMQVGTRRPSPLIRAYVNEGMRRFVEEKYGATAPVGVMIGVLLTGSADRIAARIARMVVQVKLPVVVNIAAVAVDPAADGHYRSQHPRPTAGAVTLEHLLFSVR